MMVANIGHCDPATDLAALLTCTACPPGTCRRSCTYLSQALSAADVAAIRGAINSSTAATPEPTDPAAAAAAAGNKQPGPVAAGPAGAKSESAAPLLKIGKMRLKYARNPEVPHDTDVAKRVFNVRDDSFKASGGGRVGGARSAAPSLGQHDRLLAICVSAHAQVSPE